MRSARGMGVWFAVVLLFTIASCSKANNIDNSTKSSLGIGQQCTGPDDKGCGVGAVCALGFCRSGCTTDAECPQGALCVGDRPPFGCTLPAELACSSSQPCAAPLTCGIDGKCRNRCKVSDDCIRNEQGCIAGACVSQSDPDTRWFECAEGESVCGNQLVPNVSCPAPGTPLTNPCNQMSVCHRGTPGWSNLGLCTADGMSYCSSLADTGKGQRFAVCNPVRTPDSTPGCVDVLAVPRPGLPCTIGGPRFSCADGGKSGPVPTPPISLLIDGTEFTDGFTASCSAFTLQLSASLCSRLSSGTHDTRVRVCFP